MGCFDVGFPRPRKDSGKKASIKSIQNIIATSSPVTIAEVDVSKSIIIAQQLALNANPAAVGLGATFTSSTSINLNTTAISGSYPRHLQVIEFKNVKNKQTFDATIVSASATLDMTISAVDLAKTLLFSNYVGAVSPTTIEYVSVDSWMLNNTTVRLKHNTGTTHTVNGQVLEFY